MGVELPAMYRAVVERGGVEVEITVSLAPEVCASYADRDELGEVVGTAAGKILGQVVAAAVPPF